MKGVLEFVRTTVVGGVLVVLPIVLLVMVLMETVDLIGAITEPIAAALPGDEIGGVEVAVLLALLVILLLCFLTGLIAGTQIGSSVSLFFERTFLDRVPGYKLIKGLTQSYVRVTEQAQFAVAVVDLYGDGTRVLGFIVDEGAGGDFTIFVPGAPMPTSGNVYFVARDRVQRLGVPMAEVVNAHLQWGIGSAALLGKRVEAASS
jgi:uncharacterized membrane protein